MLFQFNDSALDALSQSDIEDRVAASLHEMESVVCEELAKRSDETYEIGWDDDGNLFVGLTQEQADAEFGHGEQSPNPVVRPALIAAQFQAQKRGVIYA